MHNILIAQIISNQRSRTLAVGPRAGPGRAVVVAGDCKRNREPDAAARTRSRSCRRGHRRRSGAVAWSRRPAPGAGRRSGGSRLCQPCGPVCRENLLLVSAIAEEHFRGIGNNGPLRANAGPLPARPVLGLTRFLVVTVVTRIVLKKKLRPLLRQRPAMDLRGCDGPAS